jgi:hypothetical protein
VQWDRRLLAQFGWSYHHYATFERSPVVGSSFPLVVPDSALLMPVEGAGTDDMGEGELVDADSAVKAGPYSGAAERASADADDTNRAATSKTASAQGVSKSVGKSTSISSKAASAGSTKKVASSAAPVSATAAAQSKLGTTAPGTLTSTATHNLAVKALDAINKSLTTKHTALLATIVETLRTQARTAAAEAGDAASGSGAAYGSRRGAHSTRVTAQTAGGQSRHDPLSHTQGVPLMQLYAKLKSSLQVSSVTHLHNLLKEYFDHAVLVAVKHQSEEYLCLKPPFDFLARQ